MSRSHGTPDRHAQHSGHQGHGRSQQPADPGQSLPWHQQPSDAPQASQGGLFGQQPPPAHGYQQPAHSPQQGYYQPQGQYPAGADPYYGHYFTQGQAAAPQGYAPAPQGYGQPYDPAAYAQAQQHAAAAAHAAGYAAQGQPQYADPRSGYDLGGYATQPQGYPAAPQGYPPQAFDQPQQYDPYPPQSGPGHASPTHTGHPHAAHPHAGHTAPHPQGHVQAGQHPDEAFDDEEEYEDEVEEAKPRARGLIVVASLVGAIALGAGLAYGYKKFGGGTGAGKPAVLKAEQSPTKSRTAAADQKVGERLDQPPPAVVAADPQGSSGNPGGPRVVQTIPITPAGTVVSGPPPAAPQPPLRPTISVPGVQLEGSPAVAPPPAPPQMAAAAPQPPVTAAPPGRAVAPAPQPRVISAPEPAPAPVAKAPVQKTRAPADAAQPATVAAATTAPATTTAPKASNGYVAVLSSQGSRMEALKAYADLQQKYANVLSSKPADVQEATVNGKVWFRAVVGPPGSRNAAADLCAQLKQAGHSACFPAAY